MPEIVKEFLLRKLRGAPVKKVTLYFLAGDCKCFLAGNCKYFLEGNCNYFLAGNWRHLLLRTARGAKGAEEDGPGQVKFGQ